MAVALVVLFVLLAAGCGGGDPLGDDNRAALEQIREAGGDPEEPRPVDFFLYFPSQEQAVRASSELRSDAYSTRVERPADGDSGWLVLATKTLVLADDLVSAEQHLHGVARRNGGELDGWDAPTRP